MMETMKRLRAANVMLIDEAQHVTPVEVITELTTGIGDLCTVAVALRQDRTAAGEPDIEYYGFIDEEAAFTLIRLDRLLYLLHEIEIGDLFDTEFHLRDTITEISDELVLDDMGVVDTMTHLSAEMAQSIGGLMWMLTRDETDEHDQQIIEAAQRSIVLLILVMQYVDADFDDTIVKLFNNDVRNRDLDETDDFFMEMR